LEISDSSKMLFLWSSIFGVFKNLFL